MASTTSITEMPPSTDADAQDDTNNWTVPQESALLQSIIRHKPVGIHKHFRMIAIRDDLLTTGLISPDDAHTSIAGIWRKLGTLYDLEKLDEREDSIIADTVPVGGGSKGSTTDGGGGDEYWREFELPRDEFEELMWQKRFAPADSASAVGSSRPGSPATVGTEKNRRESTVADTDEPRSSPVSVSGRTGAAGRGRGRAKGGRLSKLQNELETESAGGSAKGSRRTSKAPSVVEPEDEVMEDVDDEGEEETGEEEDEESEEQDEEESGSKRGTASKRGRGSARRGRSRRGRRR
ncbi:hypothetical protein H2200_007084 [Cladophialophora chaetospira]|uniref:CT20 family protein n=1 Tax=Cladophialophora chaetospira TaxID=386627 RepID=A0AA39CGS4_9EURO|nr:hypothetical protein H2200_007084 [Cladophialophora chaetospira]